MMISFKRNASRGALLVGTLMMVAVVVLALFMQGDRGEPVDAVQAVTGMVGVCDGPFDENRSIQPVYEWIEDPNTGVWSVRITPDSTIRDEAAALGFSGEPVEVGWQGYYEFRLHVSNNGRRGTTLIEQKTFSVSLPSVQYAVTRVVGRNMNSLHYEFAFVIRHNGADQCRIEANHDGAAPNGLRVYLLQEPTNTPTRYYPPTNTPDCPSQALAQETIDAVGMWARAYPSGGGWKVEVWWERFYVDPDALYPVAVTQYRVGIPGLIANLRKQSSQPFYRYTTDWRGGVPAQGQTYEARLSVIGRQNCVIGERVVDFTIPVGDDVPINACEVDGPVEVVTWGYWNSSGDLDAYVRFGLVDWAEYYLVHFRHDDIVKIVPTSEQLAAGEVIFARNGSYDSPQGQNGYVVSVQPMSSTCMGTLVTVNCRQETCVQLSPLTPAPTLSSIGVCSGLAQPVAVISATVGADGQHAASVEVVSNSVVSHYDLKTVYRGGAAVDRRVTSYEAQSSISLGMYQGPENLGEYWLMTVQARGWDDNLGCGGPWGPISVMRLEGGGSGVSPGQPGTTPQPGSTPGQPGTTPRPTPTRVQVVPGDPIDWPDPVDFRTWDDRNRRTILDTMDGATRGDTTTKWTTTTPG